MEREEQMADEASSSEEKLLWHGSPEEVAELVAALAAAMLDFQIVVNDTEGMMGNRKYRYANLENLLSATRPALLRHGVVVIQAMTGPLENGNHRMTTFVLRGKASLEVRIDYARARDIKSWGSQTTYLRRYAYRALFGLDGSDDSDSTDAGRQEAPGRRATPPEMPRVAGPPPVEPRRAPAEPPPYPPAAVRGPIPPATGGQATGAILREISQELQRRNYVTREGKEIRFGRSTVNEWSDLVIGRPMMIEQNGQTRLGTFTTSEAALVLERLRAMPLRHMEPHEIVEADRQERAAADRAANTPSPNGG